MYRCTYGKVRKMKSDEIHFVVLLSRFRFLLRFNFPQGLQSFIQRFDACAGLEPTLRLVVNEVREWNMVKVYNFLWWMLQVTCQFMIWCSADVQKLDVWWNKTQRCFGKKRMFFLDQGLGFPKTFLHGTMVLHPVEIVGWISRCTPSSPSKPVRQMICVNGFYPLKKELFASDWYCLHLQHLRTWCFISRKTSSSISFRKSQGFLQHEAIIKS